jgi:O-antigen ligase
MWQKLQTAPRDRTYEAQWSKLLSENGDRRARSLGHSMPYLEYLIAAAAGLLILGLLTHPTGGGQVVIAILAAVIIPWSIYCTSRHVSWLLFVLVLIEAVAASAFAAGSDAKIGALVRYPLGLLFVLPFVSSLWRSGWRSGILRQGGFRDYGIYLIWALFSVSYSILPAVSIARAVAAILPFLAFCAIAAEVRSGEDARRMMGILLAGCGIVVAANYLAILIQPGTAWQIDTEEGMLRFVGFLTEPNEIGNLMLATIGAGVGYWPIASKGKKVLAAAAMIGALAQGVMADSRSPIVGLVIGTGVYLVWKYRAKGVIGIVVLCAFFYTAAHAIPSMHEYLDRGDVASFTGRQVAWDFAVSKVKERPLMGYGYEVEGQILSSQYFPGWDSVWSLGYQSSLHDGYVSRAVSLGIPALLFWVFIILRPTVSCFLRDGDPWKLRSMVPLAILPVLILDFTESVVDFRSFAGILLALAWAMLERERLFAREQAPRRAKVVEASKTPIVRALQGAHAS